jgi:hypothetical protein
MGLPVPSDMDGHVLTEAFSREYMAAFPVVVGDPALAGRPAAGEDYTPEGEQEIIDRLRGLGYMG